MARRMTAWQPAVAALGLALSRLVLPEIAHLMAQARRPVRSERPD